MKNPYERNGSYIFFKALSHNNRDIIFKMLAKCKYYLYDRDYVRFLELLY